MNWVDLVILGAVLLAGVIGYRVGLVTRALSWLGLAAGVMIGIAFMSSVLDAVPSAQPRIRVLIALGFIIGLAIIGQTIGLAIASIAQAKITLGPVGKRIDHAMGALVGIIAVLTAVWLITPLAENHTTNSPREVRESTVVKALDGVAPPAPDVVQQATDSFRRTFPDLVDRNAIVDPGPPPTGGLPAGPDATSVAATVKVEGEACNKIQDGTGFLAAPGTVVTNAHVVAGERATSVIDATGAKHKAVVVAFDPAADLAVLRVPSLKLAPLKLSTAKVNNVGVVYGFPGGGALAKQPARVASIVQASGKDIYGKAAPNREILVLAATLAPGDSGAPFIQPDGTVGGVAFAIDPDRSTTAFALTDTEVRNVLATASTNPVSTQACTAD